MRKPALLLCLFFASLAARAQMPQDNTAWRERCAMLNTLAAQIDGGAAPQSLVTASHGIPSIQYAEVAFDRSRAGEHNVACTVFYMAAIAERAGNGGSGNIKTAHNLLVVAQSEFALAHNTKPTATQHIKRGEEEAKQVGAKTLNPDQTQAILDTINTLPVHVTP